MPMEQMRERLVPVAPVHVQTGASAEWRAVACSFMDGIDPQRTCRYSLLLGSRKWEVTISTIHATPSFGAGRRAASRERRVGSARAGVEIQPLAAWRP